MTAILTATSGLHVYDGAVNHAYACAPQLRTPVSISRSCRTALCHLKKSLAAAISGIHWPARDILQAQCGETTACCAAQYSIIVVHQRMHVPFHKQAGAGGKQYDKVDAYWDSPRTLPAQPTALPPIDTKTCSGMCGMYSTSDYTNVCVRDNGQAHTFASQGLHLVSQAHAQSHPEKSRV